MGDTLFVNAYLLATTVFGNRRNGRLARISAEFMGVEAVHRALARQSLGKLGNDRVYQKYSQGEEAPGIPTTGQGGYRTPAAHVAFLQGVGFGFGERGSGSPGAFYEFDAVSARTPTAEQIGALGGTTGTINTLAPR